jgi:transposase
MYSSDLNDEEWAIKEPLLPKKRKTRPPTWPKCQILSMGSSTN